MKSRISKSLTALVAGLSVVGVLAPWASAQAQDANLSTVIDNEGTPISGGTLKYAMVGVSYHHSIPATARTATS